MYIPQHYKSEDEVIFRDIIRDYPLATLISSVDGEPFLSQIALIYDEVNQRLYGHCARANPHSKIFFYSPDITVLFQGPHAYISPAWYQENSGNVPTWNYVNLVIRGKVNVISEIGQKWERMREQVQAFEEKYKTGWRLPESPNDELLLDLEKGITVFEIFINEKSLKLKLSQKQNQTDRDNVINQLPLVFNERGQQLASYMKRVQR